MLTNTLLLYVTQEAWAKARARFAAGRTANDRNEAVMPQWLEEAEGRNPAQRKPRSWPPRLRH